MSKSVIIDAVRSPIGLKNGNLVGIRPDDLTAQVVKGLLARNENVSPDKIEDFIFVLQFILLINLIGVYLFIYSILDINHE